ncbi:unnamed protein product, partial [Fusarium graminearum]
MGHSYGVNRQQDPRVRWSIVVSCWRTLCLDDDTERQRISDRNRDCLSPLRKQRYGTMVLSMGVLSRVCFL